LKAPEPACFAKERQENKGEEPIPFRNQRATVYPQRTLEISAFEISPERLRMMPMNPTSTLADPAIETRAAQITEPPRKLPWERLLEAALLLVAAIFFALHFVHLKADFPNYSPWMDWAKYTDEGWYGDAAIRHYQLGQWNVPGDFNPAAALPVWPALELVLFRFTGVSVVAARALSVTVFGLILVCAYWLIRRWADARVFADGDVRRSLAPAIAVLLLAVSPFCFVFSRLAILEPLLILGTLAALLVASRAGEASVLAASDATRAANLRFARLAVALGLLLPLIVLTKTTGVFLFPAIFWLQLASSGYRVKAFVRAAVVACGVGVVAWSAYYLLFVRPRFLIDYRYLFSANAYTGITRATFWSVMDDALFDGTWIGETLFWVALAAVVGSLVSLGFRRLRGNPLVVALLLWIFGYGAFLAYHANLQPRYYLVLAIPLTMLTAVGFDAVLAGARGTGFMRRLLQVAAVVSGGALVFAAANGARYTIDYLRHPEYGWWNAAQEIRRVIDGEIAAARAGGGPVPSRLVLSISGSDLALMTGLPAICDDFGSMTLPDRVAAYRPGWFATWNDVEDDKMDALTPGFRLVRVMSIPVFDDPDRNLLILYRLDPVGLPGKPGRPGRRRSLSVQKRLRTQVGEQPSAVQLQH
jgi:4-amino-4-deoxy-L-arabinose transferase-like glycosyltransferase